MVCGDGQTGSGQSGDDVDVERFVTVALLTVLEVDAGAVVERLETVVDDREKCTKRSLPPPSGDEP